MMWLLMLVNMHLGQLTTRVLRMKIKMIAMLSALFVFPLVSFAFTNEGNYQDTCQACSTSGDQLTCSCLNRDGVHQQTSLSVPENCTYIENIDGSLACTASANSAAHITTGNYQDTCHACSTSGDQLTCSCLNRDGVDQRTSLSIPENCTYIENINGNLTCT